MKAHATFDANDSSSRADHETLRQRLGNMAISHALRQFARIRGDLQCLHRWVEHPEQTAHTSPGWR